MHLFGIDCSILGHNERLAQRDHLQQSLLTFFDRLERIVNEAVIEMIFQQHETGKQRLFTARIQGECVAVVMRVRQIKPGLWRKLQLVRRRIELIDQHERLQPLSLAMTDDVFVEQHTHAIKGLADFDQGGCPVGWRTCRGTCAPQLIKPGQCRLACFGADGIMRERPH